jgi:hypothetical protein
VDGSPDLLLIISGVGGVSLNSMATLSVNDDDDESPVKVNSNSAGAYSIDHIKAKTQQGYSPTK